MKIISFNSIKGTGKYNNDIYNIYDDFCYVMDGATAVFNDNIFFETSDLYEYMQLLKINTLDSKTITYSIRNGIKKSNVGLTNIEKNNEWELPTFTISAIKENKNNYDLYLLCDCLISIFLLKKN